MRKRTNDTPGKTIGLRYSLIALGFCAFSGLFAPLAGAAEVAPQPAPAAPVVAAAAAPPVATVIPATSYFPVLPFGADSDAVPQLLPVASNHALDGDHAGLRRAVIIIHDQTRDASASLAMLTALAGSDNAGTMLIAPQFLLDADIERFRDHLPDGGKMFVRWPLAANGGWDDGGDSVAVPPLRGVSSFTALDLLLVYLADRQFFPDIKDIVVAGNGTGGDFVQRYAAVGQAPDILDKQNMHVRFLVANAASYVYFTTARPKPPKKAEKKTAPKDEPMGIGLPDVAQCPAYNAYKYGLDALNPYARRIGGNAIKLRYVTRAVTYLNGVNAAQDAFPDTSCAALLQGADRLARAANYNMYLNIIFNGEIGKLQNFVSVPKAGLDAVGALGSRCGMAVLFGDGVCW